MNTKTVGINAETATKDLTSESEVSNEIDLQILKIFEETSAASSRFWFSGDNASRKAHSQRVASDWVKSDGKGAASASITWAVGAALASGPVAPATYFIAVGLGAALSSIMS